MFRAFRRAGWALAAAAGLGLGLPARTLAAGPIPASEITTEADTTVVSPDMVPEHVVPAWETNVVELEIELAWLADPMTFPYHLGARRQGNAVRIRGFVQNKAAHDKAIQIAHTRSAMQVVDELKVHSNMLVAGMIAAAAPKAADAEAALRETFGSRATALHVSCRPDGQVTVTGTIASLEEKTAASRRLRALPGCVAVINQLQLATSPEHIAMPGEDESQESELPGEDAADSSGQKGQNNAGETKVEHAVPHQERLREPWVPVTPAPKSSARPNSTSSVAPPATSPTAKKNAPLVPNADLLTRLKARVEAVCGKGASQIRLVPESRRDLRIELTVPDDDVAARLSEKILTMPELAAYHVDLDVKVPEPASVPPRGNRAPLTSQAPPPPPVPAPKATPAAMASVAARPLTASPLVGPPAPELPPAPPLPSVAPPPAPVAQSPTASPKVAAVPPPVPVLPTPPTVFSTMPKPPSDNTPRVINGDVAMPKPLVVVNGLPKEPAKIALATEMSKLPALEKTKPAEGITYRMPQFRNMDLTAGAAAAPSSPVPTIPARLKECVERACGRSARDVVVHLRSPSSVLVQFKASDEKEGERLAAKVMALPELSAYHVDLDVSVADEPVPPAIVPVAWHPASTPVNAVKTAFKAAPASPYAPAAKATPTAQSPSSEDSGSAGYATGVVVIAEPVSSRSYQTSTLPAGLPQAVQAACGSRADVHVLARSATNLLIQFKARDAAEAERLTNDLLNLPELRPFKVDVDVTLLP